MAIAAARHATRWKGRPSVCLKTSHRPIERYIQASGLIQRGLDSKWLPKVLQTANALLQRGLHAKWRIGNDKPRRGLERVHVFVFTDFWAAKAQLATGQISYPE